MLFEHLGTQSGDAADDEQQPSEHRRKAEIDQNRGQRAVDVERQRLDAVVHRGLERTSEADAVAFEAGVFREAEEHRDARIDCGVHAMAETGQARVGRPGLVDQPPGDRLERRAAFSRLGEARGDEIHAAGTGAAMLVADGENTGGDRRRERLAVA